MKQGFPRVSSLIDSYRQDMINTMKEMIPIKAISPLSGGSGEGERARFLDKILRSWGFDTKTYEYKDSTGTARPSLVSKMGKAKATIWFVGHTDTVAEGDRSLWSSDPFSVKIDGDKICGRGTNDNGQGVMSAMYAMKALKEAGAELRYNYGLVLAADEEVGSKFGMQKLMEEKGLFSKEDMFVVPDWGNENGSVIEIGEKGLLWLRITVHGKQVHASTPALGVNAYRYAARFICEIDNLLHSKYAKRNPLFAPEVSTFEMTKHESNVDSTNIVPGTDVSYMDCRILPEYSIDEIVSDVKMAAAKFPEVKIDIEEYVREDSAPVTSASSDIAKLVEQSVHELRSVKPRMIGIGGGTCAAFPRKKGMQAVVWSTEPDIAHQPNEFTHISYILNDAKVFAHIVL